MSNAPHITALVTCVNYDDYLRLTLPRTVNQVDKTVVLTSERDPAARKLAAEHGAECYVTETWFADGAIFNKAKVLDEYIDKHPETEWVLTLDSDIILPKGFKAILVQANLDPKRLYGAPRRYCERPKDWNWYVLEENMEIFPLENIPLIADKDDDHPIAWGVIPSKASGALQGFFQLFHKPSHPDRTYGDFPKHDPYDVHFAFQWPESERQNVPNLEVLHLGPVRANWHGRVSERWDLADPLVEG